MEIPSVIVNIFFNHSNEIPIMSKLFVIVVFNAVNTTVKETHQRNVLTKFYSNNLIALLYIPIKMCDGHTDEWTRRSERGIKIYNSIINL